MTIKHQLHSRRLSSVALGSAALLSLCVVSSAATAQTTPDQPVPAPAPLPVNTRDTPLPPAITIPPPPSAAPADVPATPITADQAAYIALHYQPSIASAQGALTAAAGRTKQARSQLLPGVTVTGGYAESKIVEKAGASSSVIAANAVGPEGTDAIALQQLLFDFGHRSRLASQASALEAVGAYTLTKTQADTVLLVKQNFYNLAQDLRLVTVNADNYRAQYQHLEEARARQVAGIGLVSDVVTAQTAVSNAALQLNIARNTAQIAQVTLAVSMGLDPRTPVKPADSDEPAPPATDLNSLIATALRARPDVLAAEANERASEDALSAARTANAPVVVGTAGYTGKDTVFPPNSGSVSAGVSLSFDPFDSGLTSGRIKEAQGNLATAKANLTSVQQSIASDVAQAYLNTLLADQRVTTAQDGVTNAQVAVQLADGRFRAGIAIFLEVTDAQAALLSAQTDLVNARSALDQSRAALAHAIGDGVGR